MKNYVDAPADKIHKEIKTEKIFLKLTLFPRLKKKENIKYKTKKILQKKLESI